MSNNRDTTTKLCKPSTTTEEYQEVYLSLLCKERGLGVSSATVNKVWPGLCISIPYSRCQTK